MTNTTGPGNTENQETSDRYRIDPATGEPGPLLNPGQRVMVGSFTIDQVASANLRTWRAEAPNEPTKADPRPDFGWSQPKATERMTSAGWSKPSTRQPLGKRTYADLESLDPESRYWTLRDQLAACQAFGKPLTQLLLPPHECIEPECQQAAAFGDVHDPGPGAFHEELGTAQSFNDARAAALLPYTGVIVQASVDDPDGWLKPSPENQEGRMPVPVAVNRDRDQLALILFGIDAESIDLAESAFTTKQNEVTAQLQATINQAIAWLELMKGDS